MSAIIIAYINLLELGTLTVTNEAAGFPKERLIDRKLKRLFKGSSTANHTIKCDQGASGSQAIDCLVIPAGHNLDGVSMYWEHSVNDSDWIEAASWTQSGNGLIYKTITSALTKRYWRARMTGLSAAPELGECFLSERYTVQARPLHGLAVGKQKNISRSESPAGQVSFLNKGDARQVRRYQLSKVSNTEKGELESWDNEWAGYKPFFIVDHAENKFFCELVNELLFYEERVNRWSVNMELLETL